MNDVGELIRRLPWDGQPYSIKRFGVTITNCDSEPVQTPGCIEGHGALLVLEPIGLTMLQVSENTESLLGLAPTALLGQPVEQILGADGATRLRTFLATMSVERNPLYVCTHPGFAGAAPLDVMVHTIDGVVIVEFETTARTAPQEPDYYALIKQSVARLQQVTTLQALGDVATQEIRALTGLDRVMVYQFHDDGHGEVVAESRRADLPPWLGLHYPAHDIPEPAREIFRRVWIRSLRDVGAPLAELIPLANPLTGQSLNMTYCALRGASVMYTEYLHNIHVTSTLTLSIRRGEKLWGLISCHHYSGAVIMPYGMRAACELLAQIVSLQHESAENRQHLQYRLQLEETHQQLITQAFGGEGLSGMMSGTHTLLDAVDATGVALFYQDRWWCMGATPSHAQIDALSAWLSTRADFSSAARPLFVTDALASLYPAGADIADVASGVLALGLSRTGTNRILWFRSEILRTIKWAGSPHDKPMTLGPHGPRLTPRRSFELFVESVHQRAVPWTATEVDTLLRFRFLLMEFIASRAEYLGALNKELIRSNEELDAFAFIASHDLKEPLRGIHKYAHQLAADTDALDPQRAHWLAGLTRLTLRMDSLLDSLLHFSRVGRIDLQYESVDVNDVIAEALEMVDARRAANNAIVVIPRSLPEVVCDRVRVREIFVNLLSNALKYNSQAGVRIEIGYLDEKAGLPDMMRPAAAVGCQVFYVKDDGIGIAPEHVDQVFKMFKRLHGRDEYGGGSGAGLTIVKKLVERHDGTVWLTSDLGRGSTFYFSLPARGTL
jgi:chemotaxis family two-component system sensor kinase Cph1